MGLASPISPGPSTQSVGSVGTTRTPQHVMPLWQNSNHHTPRYELRRIVELRASKQSSPHSCFLHAAMSKI
ncbi:unnamed protein product [Cercopithifilaria johnstoni]|uniref:Uncharacterized protein n=1 Tax=Cercopithifilaria johnstoni TaxID=2874296 RepID=A0A8J2M666_9BILA|nr:unnamed protein product [Cercopithifilaria johnstoni]